jgi:transcriptional regulator with XRE-family HTH domain
MLTILTPCHGKIMKSSSDIIKEARKKKGFTQSKFAKFLNRAQSEVSKYERGLVDPPGSIIIHCMNIIKRDHVELLEPTIENIIEKLNDGFNSPRHAMARSLIMGIILNEEKKGPP